MAGKRARIQPHHVADIRAKIQADHIIKSLTDHMDGTKLYSKDSQATVAIALLKKVLPDLSAVDLTANVDGKLTIKIVQFSHKHPAE
jgi:hypothetical protein